MIDPLIVYDCFFKLPEGTKFELMSDALKNELSVDLQCEWPKFPAENTQIVNGLGLCMVRMKAKLTKSQIDDLIAYFGLNWVVVAIRSAYKIIIRDTGNIDELGNPIFELDYDYPLSLQKSVYINYRMPILDVSSTFENPVYRQPTMADTIYAPMFAGTDAIRL